MKSGKKFQSSNKTIVQLGVIGCGSVSEMYLDYLINRQGINIKSCSDLNMKLAVSVAKKYGIQKVISVDEMLNDTEIDVILNLTNPVSHSAINSIILKNNKALFCEKPYALSGLEADRILTLAKKNRCLFYAAPDTYLSKAYKSAEEFINKGGIGKVLSANIVSTCKPVENWHPNPEFFYKKGAGPLFDRGVYYLTSLVHMLGKIENVACFSKKIIKKRSYKKNKKLKKISVESQTHYTIILKFKSGVSASLIVSFDASPNPIITDIMTIYGTTGVLRMPTPMEYSGEAEVYDNKLKKWNIINYRNMGVHIEGDVRGIAIVNMINDINSNILNYKNAEVANHVIKVMEAIEKSGKIEKIIKVK